MVNPASNPMTTRAVGPIQPCSKAYFRKKPIPSTMIVAPAHTIQRVPITCSRFPPSDNEPAPVACLGTSAWGDIGKGGSPESGRGGTNSAGVSGGPVSGAGMAFACHCGGQAGVEGIGSEVGDGAEVRVGAGGIGGAGAVPAAGRGWAGAA